VHYAPDELFAEPGISGGRAGRHRAARDPVPRTQPVLRRLPGGGVRPGDGALTGGRTRGAAAGWAVA
jgi:hypothetical protein